MLAPSFSNHLHKNMERIFRKIHVADWFFLASALLLTVRYLAELDNVPFHPDESTRIYMSSDIETFLSNPAALFWQPGQEHDPRQRYRLLDAPLDRYFIGIARQFAGQAALACDWDWSKTWYENRTAGAVPSEALLHTARLSAALFFPFSLVLMYCLGCSCGSRLNGWLAAALFCSNALVLLHTRRAMSESVLLFTALLALCVMLHLRQYPWIVGMVIGLAFCAKQSTFPLLFAGLAAINITLPDRRNWWVVFCHFCIYLMGFASTVLLLNPFLWGHPIDAMQASLQTRLQLTQAQVQSLGLLRPDLVLNTLPLRLAALLGHSFFTPPAIADVGNYLAQTREAESAYLAIPIHTLLRDMVSGSIMLGLMMFGLVLSTIQAVRTGKSELIIILIAALCQLIGILIFIQLPIQRYVIPLVPYICLMSSLSLTHFQKNKNPKVKTCQTN